jgi:Fe2+ or Zn2+ uptake regulation protein
VELKISPIESFSEFCSLRGYKSTRQRCSLVNEIFNLGGSFALDDLLEAITVKGMAISRATVFQTLKILEEAGMIDKKEQLYSIRKRWRACLICRMLGKMENGDALR